MPLRLTPQRPRTTGFFGRLQAAVEAFVRPAMTCNLQPGRSAGRVSGRPARRPETTGLLRGFGRALFLLPLLLLALDCGTARAGLTVVTNIAHLDYQVHGVSDRKASNEVTFTVRTPAVIEFLKHAPRPESNGEAVHVSPTVYDAGGGVFVPIPPPPPVANPTVPLLGTPRYYLGEMIYLRLTDLDQNLDSAAAETVLLTITFLETAATEILRVTETDVDTGIFAGYLPSYVNAPANGTNRHNAATPAADGRMLITNQSHLRAIYTDLRDMVQTVTDAALIDPFGFVFDGVSGVLIDGAVVTLTDAVTGRPAQVYGDDGLSIFQPEPNDPTRSTARVVSGGTAADTSGQDYTFPAGGFRFPYIIPGTYKLTVTPPAGYHYPFPDSIEIPASFGFVVVVGSRGEVFTVDPGPSMRIDLPLYPINPNLWLQKEVNREEASVGDFLQYRLTLENTDPLITAADVRISDRLPLGFRYQSGSTRMDGEQVADPPISGDGRTLTFTLGDLPPGKKRIVTYVVEVAAGAKPGRAVNQAQAVASGAASNIARAIVTVRETFFRNVAILVGRVLDGSCALDDTEMKGVAGVRVYLEDGSFVVTDRNGRYHFEGVEPGTHVVQVDLATLPAGYEMLPCEESSQFAGRTFSQFVDLKGGSLWRVNFYAAPKPPPVGSAGLSLEAALAGQQATLTIGLSARAVALDNLRLSVMLPSGARYLPGTATRDGQPIDDPQAFDEAVTFRQPSLPADQRATIAFRADLTGTSTAGEHPAKALLTFDTPAARNLRTPFAEVRFQGATNDKTSSEELRLFPRFPSFVADLQETDLAMLTQLAARMQSQYIVRIDVIGHTDDKEIAPKSRHLFADNQALSEARARNVADFLKNRLVIPEGAITVRGMSDTMPLADNTSEGGRAQNRRVELFVVSETIQHNINLALTQPASPEQSVATSGQSPAAAAPASPKLTPPPAATPPNLNTVLLAPRANERQIAWPAAGFVPEIPNIEVMVQVHRGEQIGLLLNGEEVPTLNFDESKVVPNSTLMISSWAGVDLRDGFNQLEAVITDSSGREVERLQRDIWFVTMAEKLEYFPEKSTLVADGLRAPTFAVRLTDRDGHPLHPKQQLQFSVSAPYTALHSNAERILAPSETSGTFETGADGLAYLQLQPTTQAGEVTVTVFMAGETQEIKAWLEPAPRDWILVGFAEGTAGHQTLSGNMVNLEDAGFDDHGYTDGRVKFFAKGAVKGEWLLTLAYDSDKPELDGDSLQQIIDPDTYYPLYGDETQQGFEAASARDIFVKLERGQFYALFGDMQTNLTKTELSKYVRSMNGFKSELQSEHFDYTVFAAETRQTFVKDEIRGDGTSGRYPLSQKDLVINSEQVTIETRDRFHPEKIVKEESLGRHVDYDIDYDAGTLYFKRPVPSRDANLNPVFIVVRYETAGSDETKPNYGGRAAVKFLDQKVEIGASHVHEESSASKGDLYGADLTVELTPRTILRAEAATTKVEELDDDTRRGDAWLAEISHAGEQLTARGYVQEQEESFGLGQQNGGEGGMRTYGVDGLYNLTPRWSLAGELYRQENLETVAKRDVGEFELHYRGERFGLMTGVREARDRFDDGETQRSRQLLVGGDVSLFKHLTLRATHEQSLGSSDENADFPTRTLLGADLSVTSNLSLFAEQEFTWGAREDTEGTRVGFKSTPWSGGTLTSAVEREMSENGERLFALFGLGQSWQVNKHWSVNGSVDRSYTIRNKPAGERLNPDVPPASGHDYPNSAYQGNDDDFTAVSVGATCQAEQWSWTNRVETRQSDSEDKIGVSSGLVGDLREGLAASARLMAFFTDTADGGDREEEEITLGLAWRPDKSRWIVLERLDLDITDEDSDFDSYSSWRVVNHLHANYRPNRKWQTSAYYGLKYVRETFDGDDYDGFTDMLASETRYNLSKVWDIGVNGAALHSWNSEQLDYSAGASVGFQMLTNTWISAGYNMVGFEDDDFSDANYTAAGPYVKFRMKFDQQTVREAVEWFGK